jgi:hypothetical protein
MHCCFEGKRELCKKLGYKNVLEYPFGIQRRLEAGNDIEMDE